MATQKQEQALQEMVENGGNVTQAMLEAGYSPNTAHTPSKFTQSKAFREFEAICQENGLGPELVIKSLVEDIKGKPLGRVSELLLACKLLGLLDKKKSEDTDNLPIPILHIPYEIALKNGIQGADCPVEDLRSKTTEELERIAASANTAP